MFMVALLTTSKNLKTTQMSFNQRMGSQSTALLNSKSEGPIVSYNMS
jgi:hypothetical protein